MSRNSLHQVLKRPLITEKANDLKDLANQVASIRLATSLPRPRLVVRMMVVSTNSLK